MSHKSKYLVKTVSGEKAELTNARILKSNNLYPFGRHNYAIYETPDHLFVKATNNGARETMLTDYELLDEATARNYNHPYHREA